MIKKVVHVNKLLLSGLLYDGGGHFEFVGHLGIGVGNIFGPVARCVQYMESYIWANFHGFPQNLTIPLYCAPLCRTIRN
jgi:hypothetical protein